MGFWTTVALVTAAIAGAGTQAYQALAESSAGKKQAGAMAAQTEKTLESLKAAPANADAAAQETLKKKRRLLTQTILTSPLGDPTAAPVGKKTLLGA